MTYRLEDRINFLREKRNKPYRWYGAVSIAAEKLIMTQDVLRRVRLGRAAERTGL